MLRIWNSSCCNSLRKSEFWSSTDNVGWMRRGFSFREVDIKSSVCQNNTLLTVHCKNLPVNFWFWVFCVQSNVTLKYCTIHTESLAMESIKTCTCRHTVDTSISYCSKLYWSSAGLGCKIFAKNGKKNSQKYSHSLNFSLNKLLSLIKILRHGLSTAVLQTWQCIFYIIIPFQLKKKTFLWWNPSLWTRRTVIHSEIVLKCDVWDTELFLKDLLFESYVSGGQF